MDVIVIGGGISGVASAFELRAAGHHVRLIEQHGTVAQQATFGHGGLLAPTPLDVWFGPGMAGLSWRRRLGTGRGVLYQPGLNFPLRRWARRLRAERHAERFAQQYGKLSELAELSALVLGEIEARHGLEFEQRSGVLYLFRTARELKQADAALALLRNAHIPYRLLNPGECLAAEPSLPEQTVAGGVLLSDARSGNCPQFVKQLKQLLDDDGVHFEMGRAVTTLRFDHSRVTLELAARPGQPYDERRVATMTADAVVVAAGSGSLPLLARANLRLPLHPLRIHAITAPIAHQEHAPHIAVVDTAQRITITRLNNRLRIAGGGILQSSYRAHRAVQPELRRAALTMLGQAAHDWIPGAAKLSAGLDWDGLRLLSPDGLPVVGATAVPGLFVNLAHGPSGWSLACGSAKVVAQAVSGEPGDLAPATLAALAPTRFGS